MKSSAKAKSFHVAVRGSSPKHVTLPSRLLIRLPADERLATEGGSSRIISGIINEYPPVTQTSSRRPSPYEQSYERSYERSYGRSYKRCRERTAATLASRRAARGLASNEPRNDTHKSLARRRAYAAIRASSRAAPGLASNEPPRYLQSSGIRRTCALKRDKPKRRKWDDSRSGKET